ncbi:MAG TPA: efflux RND transporter periplasmic adaptor subunit [Bryobacteraceae bacterium]|nr:efflux RND transporter periplasmic adaptor subunit [Bryobacteraceae bacterium]
MRETTEPARPAAPPLSPPRPRVRTRTRWILAGAVLCLAAVATTFFWSRGPAKPVYATARIDRGDIESVVTTSGTLNAVTTVQVGSQVSGNIIALYADFNTKVKKGQLVAEIDPAPFKAAVDQAAATLVAAKAAVVTDDAALAQARANLTSAVANVASQKANVVKAQSAIDLAKVENDRRQIMVKNGSTSQEDADTAKATYDQALATMDATKEAVNAAQAAQEAADRGVDVAQHTLDQAKAVVDQDAAILAQARLNLEHTRILAPVDGTVESRNMDVGQTVAASFQAPVIFLIAQDMTKMQVDTNVDESDVGRIQLDQEATFTVDAWPGRVFHGRVAQIRQAPINVQNVITYDVVVRVSNEDLKLFPGMTANVTVFVGHATNVLRLPKAALRFRTRTPAAKATQQTVNVLDPSGQLKQVPIKTGMSDANYVELVSGDLKEGDAVVTGLVSRQGTQQKSSGPGRIGF